MACEVIRGRFQAIELANGWTVVDLEGGALAAPRRPWSRTDAELVVDVLADRPGYAAALTWEAAR